MQIFLYFTVYYNHNCHRFFSHPMKKISLFFLSLLIWQSNTVFALDVSQYNLNSTDDLSYIYGDNPGAQFGSSVVSADINGDNIDDLIVGAPFSSTSLSEWNGQVGVYFGNSEKKTTIEPDLNFFGEYSGDQFGTSLAVGDFNGDKMDDLAIGAFNAYEDGIRPGKVYIVFGKKDWERFSYDFSSVKPDVLFVGAKDNDNFGLEIEFFDINLDGKMDLLAGAPNFSDTEKENVGAVYVFDGGERYRQGNAFNVGENFFDSVFFGQNSDEKFGSKIGYGSFFPNGRKTIAIGAYKANEGKGKVYLYDVTDFRSSYHVFDSFVEGNKNNEWFGFDFASNDVNKDSFDDLIVTSFPYNDKNIKGKVSIFWGGKNAFESTDIVLDSQTVLPNSIVFGSKTLVSDFNKDGNLDILVGAPSINVSDTEFEGNLFIFYGNGKDFSRGVKIVGDALNDWFAYSFAILDFNKDKTNDLAVSARYSDNLNGINIGKIYLLWGYADMFQKENIDSAEKGDLVIRGQAVKQVVERFGIKEKEEAYIENCLAYVDYCFFNFSTMSSFDGISFDPVLRLYPDIDVTSPYYESVNIATMLDIVHGYLEAPESPFLPESNVSRIQALKIVLGASGLVEFKYKFELADVLGSVEAIVSQKSSYKDVSPLIPSMWWYPRYTNFAYENGISGKTEFFRPDEPITESEFNDLIQKTLEFVNKRDEEIKS